MRNRILLSLIALALVAGTVVATSELVLNDDRVLSGTEVRRDGDNYVLVLEGGDTVVIPTALVREVRLEVAPPTPERDPVTGLTTGGTEQIGGQSPPDGPTGIRDDGPEQLAGEPVRAPTPSDQLAVFGEPAKFQGNVGGINPNWTPKSDWDTNPAKNNNFAPSKWAQSSIDPSWEPQSAFDKGENVLAAGRATWQQGTIDNSWTPTDGFAK